MSKATPVPPADAKQVPPAQHTLWTEDEAKAAILKYDAIIDMANKAGANIDDAKKSLLQAVDEFGAGNINQVFIKILEARAILNKSVRELGGGSLSKHPRLKNLMHVYNKYSKFVFPMYGFWPLLTATFFFFLYSILLIMSSDLIIIRSVLNIKSQGFGFGVPIWTLFFAGIGASVQIMVDVTNDVKTNGYVEDYRRMWYVFLPIVAPVFGFIAYILLSLGFLSLSGVTAAQLGKGTLSIILVCFLAGYSTEWFMRVLASKFSS